MPQFRHPILRDRPAALVRDEHGEFWRFHMGDGNFLLLDVLDRPAVQDHRWMVLKAHSGLRYIGRSGNILLHRVLLEAPKGITVDHIDGSGLNNRRHNLCLATYAENCSRRPARSGNGKSGLRGVHLTPEGRWTAIICIKYKLQYLGSFDDPEEAARVWDAAAVAARGKFTYLNFPNEHRP